MKKSFRVAFGGIIAALSLVSLFFSSIFPFAEYTFPAISGIFLIAIVIELGFKTSVMVYITVSILSLFIVPNKEAVALFICFLGYYPIIKGMIERMKSKVLRWVMKLIVFNVAVVSAYNLLVRVFAMQQIMDDFEFIQYGIWSIWGIGNVIFILYDMAVTGVITGYMRRIRPKYINRFKF